MHARRQAAWGARGMRRGVSSGLQENGDEEPGWSAVDRSVRGCSLEPDPVTRAALLAAAALPWFAIFSGTYGLYFYVLLIAALLAPWLLIPLLVLAAPLAALLLLFMPAGAVYAAVRRPPLGWAGRITRVGCLVSMAFAVLYGGLMVALGVAPMVAEGAAERWDFSLTWRAGGLVIGFLATWRAWRWLRRDMPHYR